MFSKSFSTVLLASTTALAACGGGGGGGGGLPDVGDNNYFDGFSGQVSALQAQIQGASVVRWSILHNKTNKQHKKLLILSTILMHIGLTTKQS